MHKTDSEALRKKKKEKEKKRLGFNSCLIPEVVQGQCPAGGGWLVAKENGCYVWQDKHLLCYVNILITGDVLQVLSDQFSKNRNLPLDRRMSPSIFTYSMTCQRKYFWTIVNWLQHFLPLYLGYFVSGINFFHHGGNISTTTYISSPHV